MRVAIQRAVLTWCLAAALLAAAPWASAANNDVAQLRQSADDLEHKILHGGSLYEDAGLNAYLQSVAQRLLAETNATPIRVRVIKSSYANAFVLPNGAVFVSTELLQRLDNEAQLATVLGHELTHYANDHALQQMHAASRRQHWAQALAVMFAAIVGAQTANPSVAQAAVDLSQAAGNLWLLASVSGYSRELESEADHQGLRRMIDAGYDPGEGAAVFVHLREGTQDGAEASRPYFASHPKLDERIASYQQLLGGEFAAAATRGGTVNADGYRAHVAGAALDQTELLLRADLLDDAARSLQRADAKTSARGCYLEAEIARHRPTTDATRRQALDAYQRAAALPDTPPDSLRQQALLYRLLGDTELANQAFRRYLEIAPTAVDAPIVRQYLQHSGDAAAATQVVE